MDSGWAALLGTVVGSATSIGTTWFSEYLRNKRSNKLAEIRKERLRKLLSDENYKWRSLERLCAAVGADEEMTAGLLLEIGARRSVGTKEVWTLIARTPFQEDQSTSN